MTVTHFENRHGETDGGQVFQPIERGDTCRTAFQKNGDRDVGRVGATGNRYGQIGPCLAIGGYRQWLHFRCLPSRGKQWLYLRMDVTIRIVGDSDAKFGGNAGDKREVFFQLPIAFLIEICKCRILNAFTPTGEDLAGFKQDVQKHTAGVCVTFVVRHFPLAFQPVRLPQQIT